ncbi:hypothetical protein CgunFtcFv8_001560 [Champsocephalus gunnari]|uniref:Uncharacterized protein n=1 Tax=Champsocephalus gunnari TaxID=52237 RepID=A0AAN8H7U0_CHAGU|nr:hypothetical protein CgunFtcFv8_001560 [Champsocephalus gunnari]
MQVPGMNQFSQMGMQPMGQRSPLPMGASGNQMGMAGPRMGQPNVKPAAEPVSDPGSVSWIRTRSRSSSERDGSTWSSGRAGTGEAA